MTPYEVQVLWSPCHRALAQALPSASNTTLSLHLASLHLINSESSFRCPLIITSSGLSEFYQTAVQLEDLQQLWLLHETRLIARLVREENNFISHNSTATSYWYTAVLAYVSWLCRNLCKKNLIIWEISLWVTVKWSAPTGFGSESKYVIDNPGCRLGWLVGCLGVLLPLWPEILSIEYFCQSTVILFIWQKHGKSCSTGLDLRHYKQVVEESMVIGHVSDMPYILQKTHLI